MNRDSLNHRFTNVQEVAKSVPSRKEASNIIITSEASRFPCTAMILGTQHRESDKMADTRDDSRTSEEDHVYFLREVNPGPPTVHSVDSNNEIESLRSNYP